MKISGPIARLRAFRKREEGQALVLGAVALVMLMMVAGLGVDIGYLRYQHQQMQKAADAGALAGAAESLYDGSEYMNAALNETTANGFTTGTNGAVVTAITPPTSGNFAGQDGYVQVTVSQPQPNFFLRVMGNTMTAVSATAVASYLGPSSGCIYALDPNSGDVGFQVNGNVSIATSCGIRVDSDNTTDGIDANGASGSVQATGGATIGVVGGYSANGVFNPTPTTGMAPFSDPLKGLAFPSGFSTTCLPVPANGQFTPGTYCNVNLTGNGTYTFAAGQYFMLGGFSSSGNVTLTGSGVTFFITYSKNVAYAQISIAGTAQTSLSAPTTGTYAGILFYQDPTAKIDKHNISNSFDGTNGEQYAGILYFPTSDLLYSGTPGLTESTDIIAWQLQFNGNVQITDWGVNHPNSPLRSALLVQ